MPDKWNIYVPFNCSLHTDHTFLYISIKKSIMCNIYLPNYITICASNKYAPQKPKIWHAAKLLDVHLWGKYSTIQATYEVAPINDATRIVVQNDSDDNASNNDDDTTG